MMLEPDGVGTVVVLIKFNNLLQYYVTDKEIWILNEEILKNAFIEKGYEIPEYEDDIRYGFSILSEKNIVSFLARVVNFKVSKEELKEYYIIYKELYGDIDVHYAATPIFYIDFDKREFYSFFTEPGSYEKYIPYGWNGYDKAGKYDKYVPSEMKYW
ncbi:hypothetical protein BD780_000886 [Clostridium tetanomorphum]|uniref:Group-specific protein n=1 Tax=Clostridium tetanomorphum TaxID=1553 RepID=A0A923EBR2_CLOTT|nr:hypothetical protein [Clostridium tetanomorphum]MBC2398781.1 hypothetical protein [Clostridium tetanomorphum]MBP1864213.1 hypothetical protein [Clostridium tetanomorphum]NRS83661.1 hypothetical protein [Clostridium tetanomorphum]NRZ96853.1 hypothetical protein [Clostridium tetanomorphum]SQC02070.1 Uncharacterised protein [Clostridium tetanomorphum]